MKTIANILLIIFAVVSIYVVKDDALLFLQNVKQKIQSEILSAEKINEMKEPGSVVNNPGPLKSLENILGVQGKLTVSGIINETNSRRSENNLSALVENKKLNASAEAKVDDMFRKQYFEHVSPSGIAIQDLADSVDYAYIVIGENLAMGGFRDDIDVVTAWMNSPGHRKNILNDKYQEIGVAAKKGNYQGKTVWIAVQHFGMPRSACPVIDKNLKLSVEANEARLKALEAELNNMTNSPEWKNRNSKMTAEYNALVDKYNNLVIATKEIIKKYNSEVEEFNTCIE